MQQKYELGTRFTYFWHKNEKKISLNFIFAFKPLRFRHACHSFLLSKYASQIKLIPSVVRSVASLRVIWSNFQGPGCQCPVSQGPRVPGSRGPRVLAPGSRVSGSHSPGSQVSGLRITRSCVSGSWVSDPDFRLCLIRTHLALTILNRWQFVREATS